MKLRETQRRARFLEFEIFKSQGELISSFPLMYTFHYTPFPMGEKKTKTNMFIVEFCRETRFKASKSVFSAWL